MNPRTVAAKIIHQVLDGRSLTDALNSHISTKDTALIQEMCYGVMRWHLQLEAYLSALMPKPLKEKDHDIHALLLIGLYQLIFMRVPAFAAINETVGACKKPWAKKLINGILRSYERQKDDLAASIEKTEEARFAHPAWLIRKMKAAWPNDWEAILDANNQHAPMTLRVNTSKITRDEYLALLKTKEMDATACAHSDAHITLDKPSPVNFLPQFKAGFSSVQDEAAGLAAQFLACEPGDTVLDACAAPGGKTCHLLENQPELKHLIAIDHDEKRVAMINENLARIKLNAKTQCADASDPDTWWDGTPFNRILLDAPCSATGVIRRHPDIKYLRQPEDIPNLHKTQIDILNALWPLLAPGGTLLYATCSVLPSENDDVIEQFLKAHPEAKVKPLTGGTPQTHGIQYLPHTNNTDGFYYAALLK